MNKFNLLLIKIIISFLMLFNSNLLWSDSTFESFFSSPHINSVYLRPDGKALLKLLQGNNKQEIKLLDLKTGKEKLLFTPTEYGSLNSIVRNLIWIDDQYFALQFFDKREGVANLIYTKTLQKLLIIDTKIEPGDANQILSVKTPGWLIDAPSGQDGQFLYAKSGLQSYIYKIDVSGLSSDKATSTKLDKIDGGQFVEAHQLVKVDGVVTKWLFNSGKLKAAIILKDKLSVSLAEFDDAQQKSEVFTWDFSEQPKSKGKNKKPENTNIINNMIPIALSKNGSEYYCLDRTQDDANKLYLVNFKSNSYSLIYETAGLKIVDLIFSQDRELSSILVLKDDKLETEIFSTHKIAPEKHLNSRLQMAVSASKDLTQKIVYEEAFNEPGQFWLESKSENRKMVADRYTGLPSKLLGSQIEAVENINGLEIPYILNLPNSDKKVPLIVMPHGGPIGVFDSPYFESFTQYWVSKGYAVLRINFRGSGGISETFQNAGKQSWGNEMLNDIAQVSARVAERKEIDSKRIGLFGMSYGGYATAMLLINRPDLFKTGVAVAGVYDLNLFLQSANYSKQQRDWLKLYVGDSKSNYDNLKVVSPVYLISKLTQPLLFIHGDADDRVDIEQSYRLKYSFEKLGQSPQFIAIKDFGHTFKSADDVKQVMQPATDFFIQHL